MMPFLRLCLYPVESSELQHSSRGREILIMRIFHSRLDSMDPRGFVGQLNLNAVSSSLKRCGAEFRHWNTVLMRFGEVVKCEVRARR